MFNKIKSFLPKAQLRIERWKYNVSYDVWVSSFGKLKDKDGNLIKPKIVNNYLYYVREEYMAIPLHRLVMMTFKPIKGYGFYTVDHINHNTRDNSIYNLTWMRAEENRNNGNEDQLSQEAFDCSTNGAKDLRTMLSLFSTNELIKKFGISKKSRIEEENAELVTESAKEINELLHTTSGTCTISVNGIKFTTEAALKTVPLLCSNGTTTDALIKTIKDVCSGSIKEKKYAGLHLIHLEA